MSSQTTPGRSALQAGAKMLRSKMHTLEAERLDRWYLKPASETAAYDRLIAHLDQVVRWLEVVSNER